MNGTIHEIQLDSVYTLRCKTSGPIFLDSFKLYTPRGQLLGFSLLFELECSKHDELIVVMIGQFLRIGSDSIERVPSLRQGF